LLGRSLLARPAVCFAVATLVATAAIHAVFFGASRYALVCLPALALLSAAAPAPRPSPAPAALRY
jgi:hypothetical protein